MSDAPANGMPETTILLVDDSRVTRELIKVYLVANGFRVVEAADGSEALARIRERKPSMVIADLRMPKLDGPGLCQAMREDAAIRDVPVVILTSVVEEASAQRCLDAGAREVLTKPIQPRPLLDSVRRQLRRPPA